MFNPKRNRELNSKDFDFRYIGSSFRSSYESVIAKYPDRPFVKIYEKNNVIIQKSFQEFARDVERIEALLLDIKEQNKVLVTIEGNTYIHLAYITAGILCDFIVAPMNPLEGYKRITEKIKQIGLPCLIFKGATFKDDRSEPGQTMFIPEQNLKKNMANLQRDAHAPLAFIFTSGSTGYSKIVMQSEYAVMSNVDALIELHGFFDSQKTIATPLPIFHVNALEFSFFCSLLSGQRLILYEKFDILPVLDSLAADKVQIFSGIPQILRAFLSFEQKINSKQLYLNYFITAAASLSPELAQKLTIAFKFKIIQGYGLSEAVNFSLLMPPVLTKEQLEFWLIHFSTPSVGVELRGNEVLVVSTESGEELGEGENGEICIRGSNLMLGYKGDSGDEVFRGGFLHTGDLGCYRLCSRTYQKYFFILSRLKDVIKRNAQTVSLREIDDYLLRWCPPGHFAIAVPFENKYSGEEIGVVFDASIEKTQIEYLLTHIIEEMPAMMRPRILIATTTKLTTESGKPKRWEFTPLFNDYKEHFFSENPIVVSAQIK